MTRRLFAALEVYHDAATYSAAMNMAIDEALIETATAPSIRFYRWNSPALSFGYFGKFADVAGYTAERDLVRRWTGGGTVFHGDDLTYSIVIPASDPLFGESSTSIYENVHRALCNALIATGQRALLTGVADPGAVGGDTCCSGHCFANPVRADVIVNGWKVAGAAQRRARAGLLHQGSIQRVDLGNGLADRFAKELSVSCNARRLSDEIVSRAREIAAQRYATKAWLRRR